MTSVEEFIADHALKNGERLTTGNFYTNEKPNAHAPIGMMGDHTHDKGEFMWSYRYMQMFMRDTRNGTHTISNAQARALGGFSVVPESMRMEMHMFSMMYGLSDTVTLMGMIPYIRNSMNHVTGMGGKFTTRSEGIGDIKIGSLWRLWAVEAPSIGAHRFHLNASVSFPSGNIEPTDTTPAAPNGQRLPYPMHLGAGTIIFYPGITYGGEKGRATWLFQALGSLPLGRNKNGFSKGDAVTLNAVGAYEIIQQWLSGSVRLSYNRWEDYDGADSMIAQTVQTAVPSRLGGERLDILGGVNILFPEIFGFENRLALEGGVPIYQWLKGQLQTESIVTFGWQGVY